MRSICRSVKVLPVLATMTAFVRLLPISQSADLSRSSVGEDEKQAVTPPEKEEGSGDKKDEPVGGLHRFMRQKMQASNLIPEGLSTEDMPSVADGSQTLLTW